MQITLLRHGRPAYNLKGIVRGKDLGEIARSYDLSGIVDKPPPEIMEDIQIDCYVVCSHLRRSIDSAEAIGCSEVHLTDPMFRETSIPFMGRGSIPLPISVWIVVLRLMWLLGYSKNGESLTNARKRARQAAARLVELAEEHSNVLLVGHGFLNYFIAKELRRCGWSGPSRPGREYWAYTSYEQDNI